MIDLQSTSTTLILPFVCLFVCFLFPFCQSTPIRLPFVQLILNSFLPVSPHPYPPTLTLTHTGNFPEKAARFYAASVILALEEIHNNGVVYRDLKPENLLLDNEGFIKVTDFGLSKLIGDTRTFTVCGTPHYLAPEIIQGTGHGKTVDLWCLGVLIYEMLAGRPPFYRPGERGDHMRLYRRITCCDYQPSSMFSEASWDLIQRLLQFKPSSRLGHTNGRLRQHQWFAGIDWSALERHNIRAPIIPFIKSDLDLDNFKKSPPNYKLADEELPPIPPGTDQSWDAEF